MELSSELLNLIIRFGFNLSIAFIIIKLIYQRNHTDRFCVYLFYVQFPHFLFRLSFGQHYHQYWFRIRTVCCFCHSPLQDGSHSHQGNDLPVYRNHHRGHQRHKRHGSLLWRSDIYEYCIGWINLFP